MRSDNYYRLPIGSHRIKELKRKQYLARFKNYITIQWINLVKTEQHDFDDYVNKTQGTGPLADTMKGLKK